MNHFAGTSLTSVPAYVNDMLDHLVPNMKTALRRSECCFVVLMFEFVRLCSVSPSGLLARATRLKSTLGQVKFGSRCRDVYDVPTLQAFVVLPVHINFCCYVPITTGT
jgi:hypothetical protein